MSKVITTELQHSGASAANITLDSSKNVTVANNLTVTGAVSGSNYAGRNLIINGACYIAQRGTTSTADGIKTVDRMQMAYGGEDEAPTQSQSPLTASDAGPWEEGFRYSFEITNGNQTSVGATDYLMWEMPLEARDIATSGWDYTSSSSYITLSFWVRSSVGQDFKGYLKTEDGTEKAYPFATGTLSANTWTKITKTIPGEAGLTFNNDSGKGLVISVNPMLGTDYTASSATENAWQTWSGSARQKDVTTTFWTTDNATFAITGVQLEVGDTSTEFEHKSYTEELLRCQRYYHNYKGDASDGIGIPGTAWGTGSFTFFVQYPVTMRANPSIEGTGTCRFQSSADSAVFDVSDFTVQNVPTDFKTMTFNKSGGSGATVHAAGSIQMQSAGSILAFSAEL